MSSPLSYTADMGMQGSQTSGGEPNLDAVQPLPTEARSPSIPRPNRTTYALMVGVLIITFLAYLPVFSNGFVYWDDHVVLLQNYNYRGFDWPRLEWMFTTGFMGHYQPLTWLSYALDFSLWGMEPWGYHLTSLLLHLATAGVFFLLARQILALVFRPSGPGVGLDFAAALSALFFAVHPLRVESVAWATERRDLTSGVFFMLTLAAYLQAATMPPNSRARRKWLGLSLAAYVLSLLGKVIGVSVPLLLVILDAWPLRRLGRCPDEWAKARAKPVWKEKLPYFAVAVIAAVNAFLVQYHGPALSSLDQTPWQARLSIIVFGIAFYLYKTLVPLDLSPLYAPASPFDPFAWYFLLSGAAVVAITIAAVKAVRRWPAIAASWAAYLVILAPVAGIVQIGPQIAADRYTYLSCSVWAVLAAGGWFTVWHRRSRGAKWHAAFVAFSLVATAAIGGLSALTWRQVKVWHDTGSLWEQAIHVDPRNGMAHSALGSWFDRNGRLEDALSHHQLGIRYRPEVADGYSDLGVTLARLERMDDAIHAFRKAIQRNPRCLGALNGLGLILTASNSPSQMNEGVAHLQNALRFRPNYTPARINLAVHYVRRKDYDQAANVLREGLKLAPHDAALASKLAWLLATCPDPKTRDASQAVTLAKMACSATGFREPEMLDILATSLAETGQFEQAVRVALQAAELARKTQRLDLAKAIEQRITFYQTKGAEPGNH